MLKTKARLKMAIPKTAIRACMSIQKLLSSGFIVGVAREKKAPMNVKAKVRIAEKLRIFAPKENFTIKETNIMLHAKKEFASCIEKIGACPDFMYLISK